MTLLNDSDTSRMELEKLRNSLTEFDHSVRFRAVRFEERLTKLRARAQAPHDGSEAGERHRLHRGRFANPFFHRHHAMTTINNPIHIASSRVIPNTSAIILMSTGKAIHARTMITTPCFRVIATPPFVRIR